VTITTTGYGDMYPATVPGRLVAAATMITGLALFGLLMNVVGKAMLTSLFGSEDLETHGQIHVVEASQTTDKAPEDAARALAAGSISVCGCGQPLSPTWRLCPMCGTPTARAMR